MNEKVNKLGRFFTKKPIIGQLGFLLFAVVVVISSNLYLQWCQNSHSVDLMLKFAFSWHTEKFFLGCLVLAIFFVWLYGIAGSRFFATVFYVVVIWLLGFANYQKMYYRMEPVYPDDLKMITELGMLKEMVGQGPFYLALALIVIAGLGVLYSLYRSIFLPKKVQAIRIVLLLVSSGLLFYISDFNNPNNLLRKAYNKTALWISYSQKMNYYNTGFIGGFLYNLKVEAMAEPADYSAENVAKITTAYQKLAAEINAEVAHNEEQPNIIYVMSESFSDPTRLSGFTLNQDPLAAYRTIAKNTYSGQMLSQNYGGGTANIEFEALTSFSMEPLNSQMTTPYTMLVNKVAAMPSLVSFLTQQNYQTTAIHPYNTSMYKRKDVYAKLGFTTFLDESSMTHTDKIGDNPFISDASAYEEVLALLEANQAPQFIHLVTMQTHMPYADKYPDTTYAITGGENSSSITNYAQDVAYSSQALADFFKQLNSLSRRTLVVFWGDHLPSIYSDDIKAQNTDLVLHETEFLMYDSKGSAAFSASQESVVTSPTYFAANLINKGQLVTSGYYQLLAAVERVLPAFEKNFYQDAAGQWQSQVTLTAADLEIYEAYKMIEYDIVAGKQYSLANNFFNVENGGE